MKYIIRDRITYWSNELGWVGNRSDATVFNREDKAEMNLPLGGNWIEANKSSDPLWEHDSVQFPRLISEIMASGVSEGLWDDLLTSMDLESDQLSELFDRAQEHWEAIKNMHCPPVSS
jgi:hypothetical protein